MNTEDLLKGGDEPKTAGIVVDNWKVEKYTIALKKAGFTDYYIVPIPIMGNVSAIKVKTLKRYFPEIAKLCKKLELDFKHSN